MIADLSKVINKEIELGKKIKREEETFLAKIEELCIAFEKETGICLKHPVDPELLMSAVKVEIDFEKSKEKMMSEKNEP